MFACWWGCFGVQLGEFQPLVRKSVCAPAIFVPSAIMAAPATPTGAPLSPTVPPTPAVSAPSRRWNPTSASAPQGALSQPTTTTDSGASAPQGAFTSPTGASDGGVSAPQGALTTTDSGTSAPQGALSHPTTSTPSSSTQPTSAQASAPQGALLEPEPFSTRTCPSGVLRSFPYSTGMIIQSSSPHDLCPRPKS